MSEKKEAEIKAQEEEEDSDLRALKEKLKVLSEEKPPEDKDALI